MYNQWIATDKLRQQHTEAAIRIAEVDGRVQPSSVYAAVAQVHATLALSASVRLVAEALNNLDDHDTADALKTVAVELGSISVALSDR